MATSYRDYQFQQDQDRARAERHRKKKAPLNPFPQIAADLEAFRKKFPDWVAAIEKQADENEARETRNFVRRERR